jgi:3-dehydroquinate dehydratase/shikimate dehydrogenase
VPEATLRTERLCLRAWRESDLALFAALNADPKVMEYFPSTLSREQSDGLVRRIEENMALRGYGFWAAELLETKALIGFIGLNDVPDAMPFAPGVEIGWRLSREFWSRGLAREGAEASLDYAFDELELDAVVSFTSVLNLPSRKLMERLGMHRDPDEDFAHPSLAADDSLSQHVLYHLARSEARRSEAV